jgi:hypothetical protein
MRAGCAPCVAASPVLLCYSAQARTWVGGACHGGGRGVAGTRTSGVPLEGVWRRKQGLIQGARGAPPAPKAVAGGACGEWLRATRGSASHGHLHACMGSRGGGCWWLPSGLLSLLASAPGHRCNLGRGCRLQVLRGPLRSVVTTSPAHPVARRPGLLLPDRPKGSLQGRARAPSAKEKPEGSSGDLMVAGSDNKIITLRYIGNTVLHRNSQTAQQ